MHREIPFVIAALYLHLLVVCFIQEVYELLFYEYVLFY